MLEFAQGDTATLFAEFFDFPGGAAIDVTNLTITITSTLGGVAVGPTSTGIQHIGTGVYSYSWTIPIGQAIAPYVVSWDATEANATETIAVVSTQPPGLNAGPCVTWDPIWNCSLSSAAMAVTGTALSMATEVLWNMSGQRFGLCQLTIRPCRADCGQNFTDWWQWGNQMYPRPTWLNGVWYNLTCGGCADGCSCAVVETVKLPSPVADILEVVIEDVVLSPTAYRLDDWRLLRRTDGGIWPICNNLGANSGPNTWSITLRFGETVPVMARAAVGELAAEFAKMLACDASCRLPWNTQSVSRQGVDITLLDPTLAFAEGRIGLPLCDLFLTMIDGKHQRAHAEVVDFDGEGWTRSV